MENRGSTLILTNLVGVHPRNIHTKFKANLCSGFSEEDEKQKVHADDNNNHDDDDNDDDGHTVIARVTLTH